VHYRTLGGTGLQVSGVGRGAIPLGGMGIQGFDAPTHKYLLDRFYLGHKLA
jgi:hypothetical protein